MEQNKTEANLFTETLPGDKTIDQRKENFKKFFTKNSNWIFYLILAFLVWLASFIRIKNLWGLKDITTGTWTLGPDLDPYLFLRWAQHIAEHGTIMANDAMRYVPLGFDPSGEMMLLSYLIAWFHKIVSIFVTEATVTYSAVIYPVFMFALTTIAFFLMTQKIFQYGLKNKKYSYVLSLISTALFIVLPSVLPRTIAGIPEKESTGFFFLFITFYFFIIAWNSRSLKKSTFFSLLAGITTGLMALVWGGSVFIYLTIALTVLLSYIFVGTTKNQIITYTIWILVFMILLLTFSTRFSFLVLLGSTSTGLVYFVLGVLLVDYVLFRHSKSSEILTPVKKPLRKIPDKLVSILVTIVIVIILALVMFGPSFFITKSTEVVDRLIHPFGTERFILTVAENRQPYFLGEWTGSFGPAVQGISITFWLFIIGSVLLFHFTFKYLLKKEKIILTSSFAIFLFALIFSRYSPSSKFDGVSTISNFLYFGGMLLLVASFIYVLNKYRKEDKLYLFRRIDFGPLLLLVMFFLGIVAARGAVRMIMILTPFTTIMISFFIIITYQRFRKPQQDFKIISAIILILVAASTLFVFYNHYQQSSISAQNFVPSIYNQQWQKAMSWVRNSTPEDSVFAHWWDYGYWLQSIGERATILDGGNRYVYWNHLMGRHVLTGQSEDEAMDFLYTHKATHLLIDSTEIGKYSAYSLIGADINFDRYSFIPTIFMNHQMDQEQRDQMIHFFQAGFSLDGDMIINQNGQEIFLPAGKAGVAGVKVIEKEGKLTDPEAILVYNNQQFNVPMKYIYYNGELLKFDGIDLGIFVFPNIVQNQQGLSIDQMGAALFLSQRTVNSNLARLYLFDQAENFNLAHSEPDMRIEQLKSQGAQLEDFAYFGAAGGFMGPIKIWDIDYPSDVEHNEDYLLTQYPDERLRIS